MGKGGLGSPSVGQLKELLHTFDIDVEGCDSRAELERIANAEGILLPPSCCDETALTPTRNRAPHSQSRLRCSVLGLCASRPLLCAVLCGLLLAILVALAVVVGSVSDT